MSLSSTQPQPTRSAIPRPRVSRLGPLQCALWLLLYALIVVYGSLILGPLGFHFVPRDPADAWQAFLATPFFDTGSDQRPDWIANLLMMIPFGFLATGTFGASRTRAARIPGTAFALLISLSFVLAVKYAQLFFPPRTVSLNYIIAQSIGAALGVGLFHPLRAGMWRIATATDEAGRLRLALDAAIVAFVAFALFPFDIALSPHDIAERFITLPSVLFSLPNAGRPIGLQVVVLAATALAAMPLGMRLFLGTERSREPPHLAQITATGAALLVILFGATLFVISAKVSIVTFALRLLGVVAGATLVPWLATHDLTRARYQIGRALPVIVPIYVVLLIYANGLATRAWMPPEQALAGLDPRGLLPLWHDYIVSKAHALQSNVVHVAMYAPIGVMVWLRRGGSRRAALAAGTMAGLLSLAIELARGLKPGLQPDFNEVLIGAIAAAVANRVMPVLWPPLLSASALVSRDRATPRPAATLMAAVEIPVAAWLPLRLVLAAGFLALAVALAWEYPLGRWLAITALMAWVAVVWLRPALWFVMLPAMVPSIDLAPWTGWIAISEADIAVLATVAVLLLRAPPTRQDLWPDDRARLFPRFVLALVALSCLVGMLRGFSMTANFPGGSDNPYLTWLNTVRLAKPLLSTLALLPFMRARQRKHGDAALLFSVGMLCGLALVGLAALAERTAFTSLSDIHGDYRIVASFSSMHVGGGHIGVYLAFAMPFMVICLLRLRVWTLVPLVGLLLLSNYTLALTFARTAYLAAFVSMTTTCCGWMIALRRHERLQDSVGGTLIGAMVLVGLIAGLNTDFMRVRMSGLWPDLATREANWDAGLGRRDRGLVPFLLGMGTGAYPRFAALRSPPDQQPGTYVVRHDGQVPFLETMFGPQFYFGQKVPVVHGATYTMMFDISAAVAGTPVNVSLCSKLLLYSADCHVVHASVEQPDIWQHVSATLPAPIQRGELQAPVELAFSTGPGVLMNLREVQLIGPDHRNVVVNGNFATGTARWFFTSDSHLLWRMKDAYLATWFEGGLLGATALLLLLAGALGGAANAMRRGDPMGAPIAGAMLAVLLCGVFDNVFEAPRIAFLFDMVAVLGLMRGWPPRAAPATSDAVPRALTERPRAITERPRAIIERSAQP
jgi:VanZ family protein